MKLRFIGLAAIITLLMAACDDNTDNLGSTITENGDLMTVMADSFDVTTYSVAADSVLGKNTIGYLGRVKDPETGSYITQDYMVQFNPIEDTNFPSADSIANQYNGEACADSVELRLIYQTFYGDSLAPMTLKAYEMNKPMKESTNFYSNFDPIKEGYVNTASNYYTKTYTLRNPAEAYSSQKSISIKLDKPYTKNNKTYNNLGTYIMQMYYEHPEYFSQAQKFINNVLPGYYFKHESGIGSMAYIFMSQINIRYTYHTMNSAGRDTTYVGVTSFSGTEEVMQTNHVTNDNGSIKSMVDNNTCSYVKTPAGIYTAMTIPVEKIMKGHEGDTLSSVKLSIPRIMNSNSGSEYELPAPKNLLLLPMDSVKSFFENDQVYDYRTSFAAAFADPKSRSTSATHINDYTFNNISGVVKAMYDHRNDANRSENWNKVAIIPVTVTTYTNQSTGATYVTRVVHDMSLSSAKLVGGSNNPNGALKLTCVYSRYKK